MIEKKIGFISKYDNVMLCTVLRNQGQPGFVQPKQMKM